MPSNKPRLKFDLYALSMVEELTQRSAIALINELEEIETNDKVKAFHSLKILVWAGLLHENEKISMREACVRVAGLSLPEISQLVGEAVEASELFEQGGEAHANPPTE